MVKVARGGSSFVSIMVISGTRRLARPRSSAITCVSPKP
jgi:hypothetical protein